MSNLPPELQALLQTTAPPAPGQAGGQTPHPPGQPGRKRRWWHAKESRKTPHLPCTNCGDPTLGNYCPMCGQRKVEVRISLRRMMREVMDDQLSLNSALPRTLGALFFRPGHLTREYVQGRIVRYIPPFRLYLVSSLVFFVALGFVADPRQIAMSEESQSVADSMRALRTADSVLLVHARAEGEDTTALSRRMRQRRGNGGRIQLGPPPDNVPDFLKPASQRAKAIEERLNAMPRREALRTLVEALEENAPFGVFVMMPLFALILKLLYVRKKRFYVEHFVFALHVHAFVFLTGTVIMFTDSHEVDAAILMAYLVYLFLALKRVYGQGVIGTFFKYVALGVSYMGLLTIGLLATLLMTALSL